MSESIPQPGPLGRLDVLLAERVLEGGFRGQALAEHREARDACWIIGALGCRGVHVTLPDVQSCIAGTSGRFMPGQPEFELVRGLRRALDHLEERAELGEVPSGVTVVDLYTLFTANLSGLVEESIRDAEPWEVVARLDYPRPEELPELLARFTAQTGYLDETGQFEGWHPVEQAAWLMRSLVHTAPFRDYNLTTGALAASWYLLANGYPPFLPQASDKSTLKRAVVGPCDVYMSWFTQVVLIGYETVCSAA